MKYMNEAEFEKLISSDRPVLVQYSAPWCVYCRRIMPAMEKISQLYSDKFTVSAINIDEEPALADREQIEVVPTLVIYQNGKALGSAVAPDSKASIDAFIEDILDS